MLFKDKCFVKIELNLTSIIWFQSLTLCQLTLSFFHTAKSLKTSHTQEPTMHFLL